MSGTKCGVLDSNILIYCSKGQVKFQEIASHFDQLFVSVITFIETLGYDFSNLGEKVLIESILNSLPIIQTDIEIASQVVAYRQQHKIKIPDAIILATAKKLNASIITLNVDDFKRVDTSVNLFKPRILSM